MQLSRKKVEQAGNAVYKIRVIHGYNGGTRIRSAIREEFSYGRKPKDEAHYHGSE